MGGGGVCEALGNRRCAVTYARVCGEEDGRGAREAEAYAKLSAINSAKKKFLLIEAPTGLTLFSLAFFFCYGPLFALVFIVNSLLGFFPAMPKQGWFFKLMGCVLWSLALVWIF